MSNFSVKAGARTLEQLAHVLDLNVHLENKDARRLEMNTALTPPSPVPEAHIFVYSTTKRPLPSGTDAHVTTADPHVMRALEPPFYIACRSVTTAAVALYFATADRDIEELKIGLTHVKDLADIPRVTTKTAPNGLSVIRDAVPLDEEGQVNRGTVEFAALIEQIMPSMDWGLLEELIDAVEDETGYRYAGTEPVNEATEATGQGESLAKEAIEEAEARAAADARVEEMSAALSLLIGEDPGTWSNSVQDGGTLPDRPVAPPVATKRGPRGAPVPLSDLMPIAYSLGIAYAIDPVLILAMMKRESGFRPLAKSPAGAIGIFQVMPATAAEMGFTIQQLWTVEGCMTAGTAYLSRSIAHVRKVKPDTDKLDLLFFAVGGYNCGKGRIQSQTKLADLPAETRDYVRAVLEYYDSFRAQREELYKFASAGRGEQFASIRTEQDMALRGLFPF